MSKAEAVKESQEDIDARLAEEAALSGEDYTPPEDGKADAPAAPALADAGADIDADPTNGKPEYDADTLAAIAGDDKPKMIPHARFNEVNEEAKLHRARVLELEELLARAKGSAPAAESKKEEAPPQYDFDDAEDRYQAAFLDGDSTKAKQIRAEIRTEERKSAIAEAEQVADRRYQANKETDDAHRSKLEFEIALNKAYAAFPFLSGDSDDMNQDAIDETLVWHQHFVAKGKTPAQALELAAAKIGPRYAPAKTEPAAKVPDAVKPDLQKGLDRAARVPGKPAGVGARASSLDVSKMTAKELKNLSAEDEAALAGDIV
ncbi:hypothetical protein ACI2KS_10300 [Pseudomonas sp. NPDC087358]|uniref:hypothetical protein n=1 Tax=Pseudomonas sp. NPDC087358 TaxID=3364439 RepID=UPI00384F58FF